MKSFVILSAAVLGVAFVPVNAYPKEIECRVPLDWKYETCRTQNLLLSCVARDVITSINTRGDDPNVIEGSDSEDLDEFCTAISLAEQSGENCTDGPSPISLPGLGPEIQIDGHTDIKWKGFAGCDLQDNSCKICQQAAAASLIRDKEGSEGMNPQLCEIANELKTCFDKTGGSCPVILQGGKDVKAPSEAAVQIFQSAIDRACKLSPKNLR